MTFSVTILGNAAALPTVNKHQTAHVLNVREQFYLIDAGEGTQTQLMRAGIHPMRINHVFISHMHGDHMYGLMPMISTMGLLGRKTPLFIYAPAPMKEYIETQLRYFDGGLGYEIVCNETDTRHHNLIYENKVMEVWSIPLRHRVPCAGFLFKEKVPPLNIKPQAIEQYSLGVAQIVAAKRGEDIRLENGTIVPNTDITYRPFTPRSYAYLSDTLYSARAANLVEGCNLMYHEATFADADKKLARLTGHSTTVQAANAALKANASKLLIGHFSNRYDSAESLCTEARNVFRETFVAEEGKTFEVELNKTDF